MATPTDDAMYREHLVDEAIAAYLAAVDAGHRPDPREFVALYRRIADELQDYFASQDLFEDVADPLQSALRADNENEPTLATEAEAVAGLAPQPTHQQGGRFGDYQLLEEIGRGGMGVVYKARQISLSRTVAIKMILAGQLASRDVIQRFRAEAEAAAKLDHPGIVPIFEIGAHEGCHYFSMALVPGQSLADRLRDGPLPAREAAQLLQAVCDAVQYAHEHRVVHRDLKPANILLEQITAERDQGPSGNDGVAAVPHRSTDDDRLPTDRVRITDFGLARRIDADSHLTQSGQIIGTPSYMSPEQVGGARQDVGPASDIYALGAVLYHALTGRPPFQAATTLDTLGQVLESDPLPPRLLNHAVPRELDAICLKCLEKEPRRRYATARELQQDLQRYLEGEPIRASSVNVWERVAGILRQSRHEEQFRGWGLALAMFGMVIFLAHLAIYFLEQAGQEPFLVFWAPRFAMFAALVAILHHFRPHSLLPTNAAERLVWVVWIGYLFCLGAVHAVRLVFQRPVAESYASFAVLAALGFFVMGAHVWGGGYLVGSLFLTVAPVLALAPDSAPLLFGALWAVALVLFGWHYWQRGAPGRSSLERSPT